MNLPRMALETASQNQSFKRMAPGASEAGFTLIEVVISLALFSLISLAGIALIDAIIRIEERTAGRGERLGQLQRAMFVLTRDLEQASLPNLEQRKEGIRFIRHTGSARGKQRVSYTLKGDSLFRAVGEHGPSQVPQLLIASVRSVRWSFFYPQGGWRDELAKPQGSGTPRPRAVAVDILLLNDAVLSGEIRRVVELPEALEDESRR